MNWDKLFKDVLDVEYNIVDHLHTVDAPKSTKSSKLPSPQKVGVATPDKDILTILSAPSFWLINPKDFTE